jgi:cation transport protein ChaC
MKGVDRSVLEQDGVRRAVRDAGHGHLLLSDEALERSLASMLARRAAGQPVWVFGYGSLVWSPMFRFAERRVARVHGYHRGFYLWSRINRGTPETPGLVLGLDRGGSCAGVAYRLDPREERHELVLLWRREMVGGSYLPRWVDAHTGAGRVRAVAFVMNRRKPGYAGRLTDEQIVRVALRAHGHYGACADYLTETAASLERHGIHDTRLQRQARLLTRVRDWR